MIEIVHGGKCPGGSHSQKELPLFGIVWVGNERVEIPYGESYPDGSCMAKNCSGGSCL